MPVVETVTVLMTDLVGSTGLASRLGPDAADELRKEHFGVLREAIETSRGTEVKNTGDGVMAVFRGAADAVECAVAIQQGLVEHRKEQGFAPQVRIGMHQAEATQKGHDFAGKGVHTAARIGALATGGQILASQEVIDAAKTRFPVSDQRSVELKGVEEPVEIASISATSGVRA